MTFSGKRSCASVNLNQLHNVSLSFYANFVSIMEPARQLWRLLVNIFIVNLVICGVIASPFVVERFDKNCPRIVSRAEWKARNATSAYVPLRLNPAPYVVIHHGGILEYCYDQLGCSEVVRSYQNLHMDVRGWMDIGYNFVIGEDGNVYEGRSWDHVGAHSPGYNTQSIGISVIGDFSHFLPTSPALEALESLISCGVALGKIDIDYRAIGHRQARNTVCPGETFYNWVKKMPRWTDQPKPLFTNETSALPSPNENQTATMEQTITEAMNPQIIQNDGS